MADTPATRRAGASYAAPFEVGGQYGSAPGSTSAHGAPGGRRRVLVGAGVGAALLLCAVLAAGEALGGVAEGGAGELLSPPSATEMKNLAWKALHGQFQREDAELQAQLGIAQLPSLKDISSGVSSDVMSSALGDAAVPGLASASSVKGAAQLRILKRYGERGQSMDNDMGFAGDAGPYSALLQTSAVVGDPSQGRAAEHVLPMLLETDGGGRSAYADAQSANGLAANDERWPAQGARTAEAALQSQAAKAAEQLLSAEKKAEDTAEKQRAAARESALQHAARESKEQTLKAAALKAMESNARMQKEQELEDADYDGHAVATTHADDEYSAHYPSLLETSAGAGEWQNPELPGEDQRPRHQRLAYNDAIQHWADSEDRAGLSPNEPRSSSMPLGMATLRVSPLRAALRERLRGQAQERLRLQEDSTATQAQLARSKTQQLMLGIGGVGPGEERGNERAWRVAMEVDPNCRETLQAPILKSPLHKPLCSRFARALIFPECVLQDMEAGSLGALMHGSKDCLPNRSVACARRMCVACRVTSVLACCLGWSATCVLLLAGLCICMCVHVYAYMCLCVYVYVYMCICAGDEAQALVHMCL